MASKYIQKFNIPTDFPNILHDLSREILRYQPDNIVEFCALYFKCMQEGKELDYNKKGSNIPCDFKNVIPGTKTEKERTNPKDKSDLKSALNNLSNVTNEAKIDMNNIEKSYEINKNANNHNNTENNIHETKKNSNENIKHENKNESNHRDSNASRIKDNSSKNIHNKITPKKEENLKEDSGDELVNKNEINDNDQNDYRESEANEKVDELKSNSQKHKGHKKNISEEEAKKLSEDFTSNVLIKSSEKALNDLKDYKGQHMLEDNEENNEKNAEGDNADNNVDDVQDNNEDENVGENEVDDVEDNNAGEDVNDNAEDNMEDNAEDNLEEHAEDTNMVYNAEDN